MSRGTWRTWVTSAVVSAVVAVGAVALTSQESDAAPLDRTSALTTAEPSIAEPSTAEPSTAGLDSIDADGRFAVAVLDVTTGEALTYGDSGTFDTASIVKVDILAALLWQHEQEGTAMSASERTLAAAMIEQSDNAAATSLFATVGGEDGLEEFNRLIGLTATDVGSNGYWGLTQTTSDDQVRLLQVVLGDETVLSSGSQAYAEGLMSSVVDTQRFGVSSAADDPDDVALKVGYLQRSATGRWDVTSIGEIEADGHTYLVAVLSDGHASFDAGVALVDAVALAAVAALS